MQTTEQANKQIHEQVEILSTHLQKEEIDLDFIENHATHLLDLIRLMRETWFNQSGRVLAYDQLAHSQICP